MNIIKFENKTPIIHDSAKIFENVYIIGDVEIGEDSSIWFGSILRGDLNKIKIGKRTNIQDLAIVHAFQSGNNSIYPNGLKVIVGDDVTIGHRVTLHACRVNDRCLIGMGSIIMDDVEIGEDCFIGAFSLLPKGKKYPPMSLVSGNPAKVIRPLREEEIKNIKKEAELYVDLKNRYNCDFLRR